MKALELDSELASARAALGHAILFHDWDWAGAKPELDRALALDPDHAATYHWYAHYWMAMDNWEKGLEASRHAVQLEPVNMFLRGHLLYFLAAAKRTDELIEERRKAAEAGGGSHERAHRDRAARPASRHAKGSWNGVSSRSPRPSPVIRAWQSPFTRRRH